MPLRRGFSRGHSPSRRQTGWNIGPGGVSQTSFSASGASILGSGIAPGSDGLTVVRLRGSLDYALSIANAGTNGMHCAVGVGVVSNDAFAIGVTAVPHPISDAGWNGWMYHRFFDAHAITGTIADGVNGPAIAGRFEIDSKAMRKLPENTTLYAIVEVVEAGTAQLNVFFESRVLFKLP